MKRVKCKSYRCMKSLRDLRRNMLVTTTEKWSGNQRKEWVSRCPALLICQLECRVRAWSLRKIVDRVDCKVWMKAQRAHCRRLKCRRKSMRASELIKSNSRLLSFKERRLTTTMEWCRQARLHLGCISLRTCLGRILRSEKLLQAWSIRLILQASSIAWETLAVVLKCCLFHKKMQIGATLKSRHVLTTSLKIILEMWQVLKSFRCKVHHRIWADLLVLHQLVDKKFSTQDRRCHLRWERRVHWWIV